jgi:hypothetical protein
MKFIKFDSEKFNADEMRTYLIENDIKFHYTQSSTVYVFEDNAVDDVTFFLLKFNGTILTTDIEIQNALNLTD